MRRWLFLIYGVGSYLLFFAVCAYMMAFVAGMFVPKTIDTPNESSLAAAVVIDLLLLALFAVQHSVMARPAFKRVWTRLIPEPIERSTYVLAANVVTILLMWQWRGIDIMVWNVEQPFFRGMLWGLFVFGWLLVPAVSMLINHFDLFGTRQVWLYFRGEQCRALPFRTPSLYRHVRHPLYIGWMIAFWATPTMTVGHLLFAVVLTDYMILAAALFEERDLVKYFGEQYEIYQRQVPMFVPRWSGPKGEVTPRTVDSQTQRR